jgi:hypothetical protein
MMQTRGPSSALKEVPIGTPPSGYFYDTFAYEICFYGIYFYGIYIYRI